jgi:hypothetical protein
MGLAHERAGRLAGRLHRRHEQSREPGEGRGGREAVDSRPSVEKAAATPPAVTGASGLDRGVVGRAVGWVVVAAGFGG